MPTPADTLADRYRRLDAFLERLRGDIYPELPSGLHTQISQKMFAELCTHFPQPPGAKVLDVGCGQGVALELFRDAGLDATGITLGPDAEACRARGLKVLEMDFAFLDFADQSFDLVWCRHAIEHSVFPFFTLAELHRILKPGGVLYLEVPAPDTSCRHQTNPNHYSVLGKSMWLELIRRVGFPLSRVLDLNFTTPAGPDSYWGFIQQKNG
ncbi:class I SAM-dependent methyltransferase [Phenylobacterium sp. LjRoot219]|uniref:class I SAM-dependent methyltransferase n=1 Tax=Phenylobacterium sp. LjRoot219 TaxID=3342283 RepID=UPI003ECF66BE